MPKITITEIDLTSPGMLNATSNAVYVPGTATQFPTELAQKDHLPRLYESLSAFQEDFGETIPIIKAGPSVDAEKRFDPGYIYATELLSLGLPVVYDCYTLGCDCYSTSGTTSSSVSLGMNLAGTAYLQPGVANVTYDEILTWITNRFTNSTDILEDKGNYNFKFICSGGYVENSSNPSYSLGLAMTNVAMNRGDCVALIDHPYIIKPKEFISGGSLDASKLPSVTDDQGKYSTMFTPWGVYAPPCLGALPETSLIQDSLVEMPASFGYLLAYASAITSNPGWYATAGAQRGIVPYLKELSYHLSEAVADNYQSRDKISINPILNVSPFGLRIWGNRTLCSNSKGNLTASSFLNIRNLCSDIKKTVWSAARRLTFEQNSDILWVNFKALITPLLDEMVSGNGLSGYQLKKRTSKQKAELSCVIRLFAIEAVEDFDIEIQLADSSTAILE